MPGTTEHFGLTTLRPGEQFSAQGGRFAGADRALVDKLLWLGAAAHHHTGVASTVTDPTAIPALGIIDPGGSGNIPAGKRAYYRYTIVDDNGLESAPGPEVYIDTPAPIAVPGVPTLLADELMFSFPLLPRGTYYYKVSAYEDVPTNETPAGAAATVVVTSTYWGRVHLTLPSLPSGAAGFNIYRRRPGTSSYVWIGTHVGSGEFIDGGSQYNISLGGQAEDQGRRAPTRNGTRSHNAIAVGGLPGTANRVYRTFDPTKWTDSFLGVTATGYYADHGEPTQPGAPPLASQILPSPPKIILTGAAEVTGLLPWANLDTTTMVIPWDAIDTTGMVIPWANIDTTGMTIAWADIDTTGMSVPWADVDLAAVVRPAYTQTYATADRTLAAYTPDVENVAYTGATDGEAKLADIEALRVAYENLRAFVEDLAGAVNSIIDDLQALGLTT